MEARKEQQSLPGNRPWTVWGETSQTRKIQDASCFRLSYSYVSCCNYSININQRLWEKRIWLPGRRSQNKSVYGFQLLLFVLALRKGRVQILLGASAGLMNYKHVRRSWQNNGIQKQKQVLVDCVSYWVETVTLHCILAYVNTVRRKRPVEWASPQTSDQLSLIVYGIGGGLLLFCLHLQVLCLSVHLWSL